MGPNQPKHTQGLSQDTCVVAHQHNKFDVQSIHTIHWQYNDGRILTRLPCMMKVYPTGKKLLIGINVRKIRDCQNRKKFKPTTTYIQLVLLAWKQHCWRMINKCKWLPPLGFKPVIIWLQVCCSTNWATQPLRPSQKNTQVIRETFSPWISSEDKIFMPCNLSSSRVNGTEFSDLAQTDQTHGIQY